MKIKILVPQIIEVPRSELLDIMETVNRKFGNDPYEDIHSDDILYEAQERGLVELPDEWEGHPDDSYRWTRQELEETI